MCVTQKCFWHKKHFFLQKYMVFLHDTSTFWHSKSQHVNFWHKKSCVWQRKVKFLTQKIKMAWHNRSQTINFWIPKAFGTESQVMTQKVVFLHNRSITNNKLSTCTKEVFHTTNHKPSISYKKKQIFGVANHKQAVSDSKRQAFWHNKSSLSSFWQPHTQQKKKKPQSGMVLK